MKLPFLRVDKTRIVDEADRRVVLKGVALGGWLMMEGYMLCGRNIPERLFKEAFEKAAGREALEDFTRSFRDTFIKESDIRTIKEWGANCVRIPFNYRVVEFEGLAQGQFQQRVNLHSCSMFYGDIGVKAEPADGSDRLLDWSSFDGR